MAEAPVAPPFRILPRVTESNSPFWTGGAEAELRIQRCQDCHEFLHPPAVICPVCHSKRLEFEVVSGRATVFTFSVNYQPWMPGPELPYVVAIVALDDAAPVRLTTNIVNCDPESVEIGMPVQVIFEQHDDVWIPLFEPSAAQAAP
jgi:uncharacterized OB-fold protein